MNITVHIRKDEKVSAIRKDGNTPAVVYGKHIKEPLSVFCKKNDFIKIFKETGHSTPITIKGK
jgi:ribosomal protein L25 (general stress protein Ctc)